LRDGSETKARRKRGFPFRGGERLKNFLFFLKLRGKALEKAEEMKNQGDGQMPGGFSPFDHVKRMIGYAVSLPEAPFYDEDRKVILNTALSLVRKSSEYGKLDNFKFYQSCFELCSKYDKNLDDSAKQEFLKLFPEQGK